MDAPGQHLSSWPVLNKACLNWTTVDLVFLLAVFRFNNISGHVQSTSFLLCYGLFQILLDFSVSLIHKTKTMVDPSQRLMRWEPDFLHTWIINSNLLCYVALLLELGSRYFKVEFAQILLSNSWE